MAESLADFFSRLENHGASFNWEEPVTAQSRDLSGDTPLHWAVYWGDAAAIDALVAAGADVNAPGEYENSPLHYAAERNHAATIMTLLAAGASPNAVNALGETPRELAASLSNLEAVSSLAVCSQRRAQEDLCGYASTVPTAVGPSNSGDFSRPLVPRK